MTDHTLDVGGKPLSIPDTTLSDGLDHRHDHIVVEVLSVLCANALGNGGSQPPKCPVQLLSSRDISVSHRLDD